MSEVVEQKVEKVEKRAVFLQPERMGTREHRRQDFAVNAEAGTRVEDVLDPQYWAHVANTMEPYARVEVLEESGEWMLELLVLNVGRNWAQVHLLHKHDLSERAETMPNAQTHKVEWKGPQRRFAVIRISDSQCLQDGFVSKLEAQVWSASHGG